MPELGDGTQTSVFRLVDSLAAHVDVLLDYVSFGSRLEAVVGVQVLKAAVDDAQICGPHMLGSVHPETCHTEVNQMVQKLDNLILHIGVALVQIAETNQLDVSHLVGIIVVADGAGGIEVQ